MFREGMPAVIDERNLRSLRDEEFDKIFPAEIRALSDRHWTPASIANRAAKFLVTKPGTKVLDVGSGPGKFCIVGALSTSGHFTGIEQRERLVNIARETLSKAAIANARIIRANVTEVDFSEYDAFYLFNPFTENLLTFDKIDDTVQLSGDLYRQYTDYVACQLALAPLGTRIVTYWNAEVPIGYSSVDTTQPDRFNLPDTVRFWQKTRPVSASEVRIKPSVKVRYKLSAFDLAFEWCDQKAKSAASWLS